MTPKLAKPVRTMRLQTALVTATLFGALASGPVQAQESAMVWQLVEPSPNQAQLEFGVPETDNIRARAVCGGTTEKGTALLTLGLDFGDKADRAPISVRFSGGGSEQQYKAKVVRPQSEEGLYGGSVALYLNDPLWSRMTSLDSIGAAVPGFTASRFELRSGHAVINQFLNLCRDFTNRVSTTGNGDETDGNDAGGAASKINQQEAQVAFKFAQELDSVAAYTAFLKNYPTGFYADLARAYLEKVQGTERPNDSNNSNDVQTDGDQSGNNGNNNTQGAANLEPLSLSLPNTRWVNFSHEQDEGNAQSYAAGITSNGAQLIAWCGANKMINLELTENGPDIYPQFEARTKQGLDGQSQSFAFSNGQRFTKSFTVMELNGAVAIEPSEDANSALLAALVREDSVTVGTGVFSAPFPLRGSKQAICNVLQACGAFSSYCSPRRQTNPSSRDTFNSSPACRPRSVLINGECILRRYADQYRRKLGLE